jgi:V8-like Glu-specific endopeptidase
MADVDEYPPVDIPNLKLVDVVSIHESVVKLCFYKNRRKAYGTGFFINIPDSPYEVILTAGHNLYTQMKTFTTEVTVLLPHPNRLSAEPYTIGPIPAEHIKLSADYLKDPNLSEADYGVILIPYTGKQDRRGLGFKMIYAFTELRGEATVSGYREDTPPGRPVMSTGVILTNESTENQLVYGAPTEQGISGSPVWITYKIGEVAVATVVAVQFEFTSLLIILHPDPSVQPPWSCYRIQG